MAHRLRCSAAATIAFSVVMATSADAARITGRERATAGARYLVAEQGRDGSIAAFSPVGSTADAVTALVASGREGRPVGRALGFLREEIDQASTVGLRAKVILAAVAAGEDPRAFAGRDLVGEIVAAQQTDGRYGATTPVIEHALALLALRAAGAETDEGNDFAAARAWLVDAQCPDGGWQYDEPYVEGSDDPHCFRGDAEDFFTSDTNTTSYAIQAIGNTDIVDQRPRFDYISFFESARDPVKGGWIYAPGSTCEDGEAIGTDCFVTDANSTALVIRAYARGPHPLPVPDGAMKALKRLQYDPCSARKGAWAFTWAPDESGRLRRSGPDIGATIDAVLGVLKAQYPVLPGSGRADRPAC